MELTLPAIFCPFQARLITTRGRGLSFTRCVVPARIATGPDRNIQKPDPARNDDARMNVSLCRPPGSAVEKSVSVSSQLRSRHLDCL
jgi:hypothetical protein